MQDNIWIGNEFFPTNIYACPTVMREWRTLNRWHLLLLRRICWQHPCEGSSVQVKRANVACALTQRHSNVSGFTLIIQTSARLTMHLLGLNTLCGVRGWLLASVSLIIEIRENQQISVLHASGLFSLPIFASTAEYIFISVNNGHALQHYDLVYLVRQGPK